MALDSTIWRTRFAHIYDVPKDKSSGELKLEYQTRAIVLPRKIDFKQEQSEQQQLWLEVIQTMLTEALTISLPLGRTSKTLERLRETMMKVEFLKHSKREKPSELFCAVQLVSSINQNWRGNH